MDSGSRTISRIEITSGRAPPRYSTDRQPHSGTIRALSRPQVTPPSGIPTNKNDTTEGKIRLGAYSDASATTLGMAPPKPRPVAKRTRSSSWNVVAWVVRIENTAKLSVEKMTVHLRPHRSAIGPVAIAAIIRPIRLAEKIGP